MATPGVSTIGDSGGKKINWGNIKVHGRASSSARNKSVSILVNAVSSSPTKTPESKYTAFNDDGGLFTSSTMALRNCDYDPSSTYGFKVDFSDVHNTGNIGTIVAFSPPDDDINLFGEFGNGCCRFVVEFEDGDKEEYSWTKIRDRIIHHPKSVTYDFEDEAKNDTTCDNVKLIHTAYSGAKNFSRIVSYWSFLLYHPGFRTQSDI